MATALAVSAVPVLVFHSRFRPSHPIALWHRLQAGGPAQHEAAARLAGGLRLDESAMGAADAIFPLALAAMYRAHVVQGYSAVQPCSLHVYPPQAAPVPLDWRADYSNTPAASPGRMSFLRQDSTSARFRLLSTGNPAPVRIAGETHNHLTLEACPLPAGESLVRTDTYYPGWVARSGTSGIALVQHGACFSIIPQAMGIPNGRIPLEYAPRYLPLTFPCSVIGLFMTSVLLLGGMRQRKSPLSHLPA